MIEIKPNTSAGTAEIWVRGKLESADFKKAASIVDPMIADKGKIKGLLICIDEFKGWDDLQTFFDHVKFVKAHHQFVERIAAVGSKSWQEILPNVAKIFVKAEPRYFDVKDLEKAREWISAPR